MYNDCTIRFCELWKWQCHELKTNQSFSQSTQHKTDSGNSCMLAIWPEKSFKKNCQTTMFASITAAITQKKKNNWKKNNSRSNHYQKLYKNVKNMSFSYRNKKKPLKNSFIQINSFILDILNNGFFVVIAFVDIKYISYNIVNDKFVWHFNISHVFIQFCFLKNVKNDTKSIKKIICLNIDFLGHKNKKNCMYIFNKMLNYDMLLKLF